MRPSTPRPALLCLDAMGTLLRLAAPAPALRDVLADRFGVRVSDAQARRALTDEITYYRAHLQDGDTPQALARLRTRCAEVLRGGLPASVALDAVSGAELTGALLAALRFEAYGDAPGALRRARERGQRVVVVSNWDCSLGDVLERVGLAGGLDGVLTSAEVGAAKPSPVIFQRALDLAGVAPEQALHVGDSVAEDIEGARAAGLGALLVARDGRRAPAGVATIATLAEL